MPWAAMRLVNSPWERIPVAATARAWCAAASLRRAFTTTEPRPCLALYWEISRAANSASETVAVIEVGEMIRGEKSKAQPETSEQHRSAVRTELPRIDSSLG